MNTAKEDKRARMREFGYPFGEPLPPAQATYTRREKARRAWRRVRRWLTSRPGV